MSKHPYFHLNIGYDMRHEDITTRRVELRIVFTLTFNASTKIYLQTVNTNGNISLCALCTPHCDECVEIPEQTG